MFFRILMTVVTCAVLGLMLWDQLRLNQMRPFKWGVFGAMCVVLLGNTWLTTP